MKTFLGAMLASFVNTRECLTLFLAIAAAGAGLLAAQRVGTVRSAVAAAGLFALATFPGHEVGSQAAAAVAALPFVMLGLERVAAGQRWFALGAGLVLVATACFSERSCFAGMYSFAVLFALMQWWLQPSSRVLASARDLALTLACPWLVLPLIPVRSSSAEGAAVTSLQTQGSSVLPTTSVIAAIVLVALVVVAHELLALARDHPQRLLSLHPSRRSQRSLVHADLLMAGLAGLLVAVFVRAVLEAGATHLFWFVIEPHGLEAAAPSTGRSSSESMAWAGGAYLGPSLLLLVLCAPALVAERLRTPHFRFCLMGWMLCLLLAMKAPPFSQLWSPILDFSEPARRCLLGLATFFAVSVVAYVAEGLCSREQIRPRGVLLTLLTLFVAIGSCLIVGKASGSLSARIVSHWLATLLALFIATVPPRRLVPAAESSFRFSSLPVRVIGIAPLLLAAIDLVLR